MSGQLPKAPAENGIASALRGVARLARGDAEGLANFGSTPQAFLASLTPWIAFSLVAAVLQTVRGQAGDAVIDVLATVGLLLLPAVLSHALARAWGREERWLLYSVVFNWCHWIMPVAAAVLLIMVWLMLAAGVAPANALLIGLLALAAYALWLQWFVTRKALALDGGRSALLVFVVSVGTGLLVMGPGLLVWLWKQVTV